MEFDYVIVGGGSGGATLAGRLSEDPKTTVCLLEAGGKGDGLLIRAPAMVAAMVSGRPKINNWALKTTPQPELNGRRGFQPRGRALGGSSAINAMLYVRGHRKDYDEWAALGAEGWGWDDVLPYFLKAEGNARGADGLHGTDGPLQVGDISEPHAISPAFVEAGKQCQHPENHDFNGPTQEGVGLYQVTQFRDGPKRGERCSAAAAYLLPHLNRPNLQVITGTQAHRVLFDGPRAIGVTHDKGEVRARREVILSAGAFQSPQLLMLSGIGPGDHLRSHGIEVRHDSPQVGQNLQDHLDHVISYHSLRPDTVGLTPRGFFNMAKAGVRWARTGQGLFATPFAEGAGFLRSDPGLERPDLQLHFVAGIVDQHMRKLHFRFGYSCHVCVLRPHSRGQVTLKSTDPRATPRIDPGFLSDGRDLDLLVKGARMTEAIMEAPALAPWRGKRLYPHDGTDDAIREDIRNRADTIYHPVGTVRMGGSDAPCDPQGQVRGVDGLRVVDASLMPRLIGGNTNAPTIMMAEKISAMMRAN
ncbi:GMC family oxidoreductase [Aliiroseovarius sp.]|uniref:GMC family oxidoreductase n=1 Tax=Aliiroseovarius sp. TaxID=1872442 RepID=UPI003BA9A31E